MCAWAIILALVYWPFRVRLHLIITASSLLWSLGRLTKSDDEDAGSCGDSNVGAHLAPQRKLGSAKGAENVAL